MHALGACDVPCRLQVGDPQVGRAAIGPHRLLELVRVRVSVRVRVNQRVSVRVSVSVSVRVSARVGARFSVSVSVRVIGLGALGVAVGLGLGGRIAGWAGPP